MITHYLPARLYRFGRALHSCTGCSFWNGKTIYIAVFVITLPTPQQTFMIVANSIDEVITHLDIVIAWSTVNQSRVGYFATLYRRMTIAVQLGIHNNVFADGKRMERLDVIFANRYLQAWEAYINKKPCSTAWCKAFDSCSANNLIVLQHLLIGINTHINLDLAIAAAQTCPGNQIYSLQGDFEKINDVIALTSQDVQNTLCNIWFPLRMLQKISNKREEAVLILA